MYKRKNKHLRTWFI